jgi:hypothetical protein
LRFARQKYIGNPSQEEILAFALYWP